MYKNIDCRNATPSDGGETKEMRRRGRVTDDRFLSKRTHPNATAVRTHGAGDAEGE